VSEVFSPAGSVPRLQGDGRQGPRLLWGLELLQVQQYGSCLPHAWCILEVMDPLSIVEFDFQVDGKSSILAR